MADAPLAELIQEGRLDPAVPVRIGRHDVLLESGFGNYVYLIRGDRVLVVHANKGYREDVVAALLDAVDDLIDIEDLGSTIRLRPIDVPGFPLDRAVLLGPGYTDFFRNRPIADRGMQVIPVHRSEAVDGEEYESFWPGVIGKNLGMRHYDWTRAPVPRADVWRLDDGQGGPFRRSRNSRRSTRPALVKAAGVLERDLPTLPPEVRLSVRDVRGYDLRVRREWDRLRGTLQAPGASEPLDFDISRLAAGAVFGPLFAGGDVDPAALNVPGPLEPLLLMSDRHRDNKLKSLDECLEWLAALAPVDGHYLVFAGRSGGVVQMRWQDPGPRLWLESPDPAHRHSRGRYITPDEAVPLIRTLALEDRVAVDDLGDLETVGWE